MFNLESKPTLQAGELIKSSSKGFMQETDLMIYDVIDASGKKTGTVEVEDHTAVKGFRRTVSFIQRGVDGKVLVDDSWSG